MAREVINTPAAPGSATYGRFPYSQAIKAAGLVFVAGQGPTDAATGATVGTTIGQQTAQCLRNVQAILEAAGSDMSKVVSATFILKEPGDFAGMNEEWTKWFPVDPPARQGARHPLDVAGILISVAVVAEA